MSLLVLAACEQEGHSQGEHSASIPEAPAALTDAALAMVASVGDWTPTEALWPYDLGEHPDAPLETREWFVLLADSESAVVHGLQQRLTRIALSGESSQVSSQTSDPTSAQVSAWTFKSVMQAGGRWDRLSGSSSNWLKTERVAAGLAQAFKAGTSQGVNAHLLGHTARFTAAGRVGGADSPDACTGSWILTVPGHARLSLAQQTCPQDVRSTSLMITRSAPLLVSGQRYENKQSIPVNGVAWMRHSWGGVDTNESAVLLNTMVLTLRGLGTLEVIATSRKSGQGTAVITASIGSTEFDEVSWDSVGSCTAAYGCESQLRVPGLDLDVTVQAVAGTDVSVDFDGRVRRVVLATGTHKGGGYTDIEGDNL